MSAAISLLIVYKMNNHSRPIGARVTQEEEANAACHNIDTRGRYWAGSNQTDSQNHQSHWGESEMGDTPGRRTGFKEAWHDDPKAIDTFLRKEQNRSQRTGGDPSGRGLREHQRGAASDLRSL